MLLGFGAVLPPGGGEPAPLGPIEAGGDAGGGVLFVEETAEVVTVVGGAPVTAPVEAMLLSLSVHKVVVAVATMVDSVPLAVSVVASELDEVEAEEDETVTLCVNVVAVVVAEDEVAVYVGVQSSAGKVNVPLELPDPPYTTQFLLQAPSPVVLEVCQQGE